jgi:hypothetical protein
MPAPFVQRLNAGKLEVAGRRPFNDASSSSRLRGRCLAPTTRRRCTHPRQRQAFHRLGTQGVFMSVAVPTRALRVVVFAVLLSLGAVPRL